MSTKSIAVIGTLAFVAGISALHYSFNVREDDGKKQLSTSFRVGFLPVT